MLRYSSQSYETELSDNWFNYYLNGKWLKNFYNFMFFKLLLLLRIKSLTTTKKEIGDNCYAWRLKNGKAHNINGPAAVFEIIKAEYWCYNGLYHRLDGPSYVEWDRPMSYHIMGRRYTQKQFWEKQKNTKYGAKIFAEMFGQAENDSKNE